ncbi:nuclear transport factor 2 family protein (plasmid) [Leisingera aquaemixtae]|uniref:Nuclear transport factor 2 family protein n=1 Tax=Leisingera aquaemixtae TaxID=1396826 RepID=A0ABY5WPW6_9RHOB|nr:nuclear transport factor 2 family protein [Leisingera aquaemixtae]UWQ43490.1 nuclear transport factor 2 family protein [Leisingera aquaemixtae]
MTPAGLKQVGALMEAYFEGLHQADSALLRKVFHPRLAYVCATEGDELYLDLETYMARVDSREPPAKRGEARKEEILEIAFASGRLARVSARMTMMGRDFHDLLTLVRYGAEWRIVAKVFSYVPRKD